MLNVNNVTLQFGKRILFEDVNIKFHGERCYGLIGANGAGKSTFLKILSDEISPNSGNVTLESGKRMSVLSQNHFAFDEVTVLNTVIQGNQPLWDLMQEKDAIYMKPDFNDLVACFTQLLKHNSGVHTRGCLNFVHIDFIQHLLSRSCLFALRGVRRKTRHAFLQFLALILCFFILRLTLT